MANDNSGENTACSVSRLIAKRVAPANRPGGTECAPERIASIVVIREADRQTGITGPSAVNEGTLAEDL